jgi:hypothetical protein
MISMMSDTYNSLSEYALRVVEKEVERDYECVDLISDHLKFILHMDIGMEKLIIRYLWTSAKLYRSLSCERGLRFLHSSGYLLTMMNKWSEYGIEKYFADLENDLFKYLIHSDFDASSQKKHSIDLFPHFFGELANTKRGCDILSSQSFFANWSLYIRRFKGSRNINSSKRIKAILWSLGHIGTKEYGFKLLLSQNLISEIVRLAHNGTVLSIRGTCFFVLNLISTNPHSLEVLIQYGWEPIQKRSVLGICVPQISDQLLDIPDWKYTASLISKRMKYIFKRPIFNAEEEQVLINIGNLCNPIAVITSTQFLTM